MSLINKWELFVVAVSYPLWFFIGLVDVSLLDFFIYLLAAFLTLVILRLTGFRRLTFPDEYAKAQAVR